PAISPSAPGFPGGSCLPRKSSAPAHMTSIVRTEEEADTPAIFAVHRSCFPSEGEARLVDALRAAGRLAVSLVAIVNDEIDGHIAFSPVTTEDGATGLGLAPLAVVEEHRRKGIGAHLVRTGLL